MRRFFVERVRPWADADCRVCRPTSTYRPAWKRPDWGTILVTEVKPWLCQSMHKCVAATNLLLFASIHTRSDLLTAGDKPTRVNLIAAEAAPRLSLVLHSGTGDETLIPCRRVVTLIGSRPGCKVNLRHQRVAPVHAAIVNDGSRILAIDLVTKKGTLLNGLNMEHEPLDDGDVLTIHNWEFHVQIREPTHSGRADAHPFGLDPSPRVVALEQMPNGRILRPGRDLCIIGRRNGCDVAISDTCVSRVHALLFSYFGHPVIFDLLSSNHTFVNDTPVGFRRLKNEDVVTIGECRFRVRLVGSAISERAARAADASGEKNGATSKQPAADLIDIHATESKQRWRIADNLEEANRKR